MRHVFPPLQVNIHMCTMHMHAVSEQSPVLERKSLPHTHQRVHTGGVQAQYCCEHCSAVHSDIYSGYCCTDTLLN